MGIATIISFCSNDYRFIAKCIHEAHFFSEQVIVSVCDHFFDGSEENRDLLNWVYYAHPNCQFVEFPYSHTTVYPTYFRHQPEDSEWSHHWHSFGRLIGFYHVDPKIEWILFLDADEIVDGLRFSKWIKMKDSLNFEAARLGCYYYALRANLRATKIQELSLFVMKEKLEPKYFYHGDERFAVYKSINGRKKADVRDRDKMPMIHHYSWVRPEKECRQKSKTWGHRLDCDWDKIINETFGNKKSFFGINLEFQTVKDVYFDPLSIVIPQGPAPISFFHNVKKLTYRDYMKLELEWAFIF